MGQKAKGGGTVGMAKIGYRNVRTISDEGREVRSVEVDPDRAPLVSWAFEEYATGEWSLNRLTAALADRGLDSRPTPKKPSKPLAVNQIHQMLRSPYYRGVVVWQGVEYPGRHEPLVDERTWRKVQEMLTLKRTGEKERTHNHYLKSSVFCGSCGARLIITNAKNHYGVVYPYFVCGSRHQKRNDCTAKAVLIADVEAEVIEFYKSVQLTAEVRGAIEQRLLTALDKLTAAQDEERQTLTTRLYQLKDQQAKLLQAHYAGAVPLDLLASEQERLGQQRASVEQQLDAMQTSHESLRANLRSALDLVEDVQSTYRQARPKERRMLNQALFTHLYVKDETTEGKLNEPFSSLKELTEGMQLSIALSKETYRRSEGQVIEFERERKGSSLKEALLVPQARVELATFRLGGGCSIH